MIRVVVIYHLSPVSDKQTASQRTPACGSIAQLGEHLPYKQRVTGSSPVVPTIWPGSSVG